MKIENKKFDGIVKTASYPAYAGCHWDSLGDVREEYYDSVDVRHIQGVIRSKVMMFNKHIKKHPHDVVAIVHRGCWLRYFREITEISRKYDRNEIPVKDLPPWVIPCPMWWAK